MASGRSTFCCDLLSFYYLCRTGNNCNGDWIDWRGVVICFHFTIFVVLETTQDLYYWLRMELWFAFILLSLSYWKQHGTNIDTPVFSCDLLSFYYLCRTGNNNFRSYLSTRKVVICFHFTIFVVLETTLPEQSLLRNCCDLLSFYYLCRTGNNVRFFRRWSRVVVICFHFTIFVVLETT